MYVSEILQLSLSTQSSQHIRCRFDVIKNYRTNVSCYISCSEGCSRHITLKETWKFKSINIFFHFFIFASTPLTDPATCIFFFYLSLSLFLIEFSSTSHAVHLFFGLLLPQFISPIFFTTPSLFLFSMSKSSRYILSSFPGDIHYL